MSEVSTVFKQPNFFLDRTAPFNKKMDRLDGTLQKCVSIQKDVQKTEPGAKTSSYTQTQRLSLRERISRLFWSLLGCHTVYNLADAGLARFLVLETLTHGTSLPSYIRINLRGADPRMGGAKCGSSAGIGIERFVENSKNFFHVFKDSWVTNESMFAKIYKPIAPRLHASLAGSASAGNGVPKIIGAIAGFFTPTIKFRFTPAQITPGGFENDPDYEGLAYRTPKPIGVSHIGMTGSIIQGINPGVFSRMRANPGKVLCGVALLTAAVYVGKKTYSYIKSNWTTSEESSETCEDQKKAVFRASPNRKKNTLACAAIFFNLL